MSVVSFPRRLHPTWRETRKRDNTLDDSSQKLSFVDRVQRMLERVEYRRADSEESKNEIFRMRHDAYTRGGKVAPRASGMFRDELDDAPNVWLIAAYIDGELASSVRLHVSAHPEAPLPAMNVFSDVVVPHLKAGECLIDITRHVNKIEFTRDFPEMPYLTLRSAFLAEQYFHADYILGACRVEHQNAFKRMFGVSPWSEPREYPMLNRAMPLFGYHCRDLRERTLKRYPFYAAESAEREHLFARSSNVDADARITVRSAARRAVEAA